MFEYVIKENESSQRFDKFLHKYLPDAGSSFLYKMLRKKNITLNGKKAEGKEQLNAGDVVRFFLAEETLTKFKGSTEGVQNYSEAFKALEPVEIVYENKHILVANKPAGVLSQKAEVNDCSLNEWLIGYLLEQGTITEEELATYKPSVCNRLDRNTSGMVICAKTLAGSQEMSRIIKNRKVRKFYRLFVKGQIKQAGELNDSLRKDHKTNKVQVGEEGSKIITKYEPLKIWPDRTLLEVELITGKTHQIRAHLASAGYPLIGDYKYGDKGFNDIYKKRYQVESQLLHAYRLEFPQMSGAFQDLSELTLTAQPPEVFYKMER